MRKTRVRLRLARDRLKESILSGEIEVNGLFETDEDLIEMTQKMNKNFLKLFETGFKCYMEGYWPEARKLLQSVSLLKAKDDEPSLNLLRYMAKFNYVVPDDWMGLRKLDSK